MKEDKDQEEDDYSRAETRLAERPLTVSAGPEKAKRIADDAKKVIAGLVARCKKNDQRIMDLEKKVQEIEAAGSDALQQLEEKEAELGRLREENRELDGKIQDKLNYIVELEAQVAQGEAKEADYETTVTKLASAQQNLVTSHERVVKLEDKVKSLEAKNQELREMLDDSDLRDVLAEAAEYLGLDLQ